MRIVLVGIMGCGKTTIAYKLAKVLKLKAIDLDQYIEEKYKQTIPEMFDISEEYFRTNETTCLQEVLQLENCIIATGGGIVGKQENRELLKQEDCVIYIDRPVSMIASSISIAHRPLLKDGPQKLYALHKIRNPLYKEVATIRIKNQGSSRSCVRKIINIVNNGAYH